MDLRISLLMATILLALADLSSALSCYQCDSTNHPDCKEEFDHEHMDTITIRSEDCSVDAASYCVKTTGVWGGVVGTTRFCSSRDMGNECKFVTYPNHDRVYRACIYTCKGHHCNSAPTGLRQGAFTAVFVGVLVGLFNILR